MTAAAIVKEQERANVKYETAKKIRALLDEAKKAYGPGWEDDDVENSIVELVTGES